MNADIELTEDDLREAIQLLCDERGLGRLVSFEVVASRPPDPPYAQPEKVYVAARVEMGARRRHPASQRELTPSLGVATMDVEDDR
jgi:hypothetical protein